MTAATETENDEATARKLLLSLRLLDSRRQRLELEVSAKRKEWKDQLTATSKELHAKIDDGLPTEDHDCRKRLKQIQNLFRQRQREESARDEQVDAIQSKLKSVEAAIVEVIRSEPSAQRSLDFDEGEQGMTLTKETAVTVASALQDALKQGAQQTPDMDDLRSQLERMGAKGLRVVDPPADEPANDSEVDEDTREDEGEEIEDDGSEESGPDDDNEIADEDEEPDEEAVDSDEPPEASEADVPALQSVDDWPGKITDRNGRALKPGYRCRVLGSDGGRGHEDCIIIMACANTVDEDGDIVLSLWNAKEGQFPAYAAFIVREEKNGQPVRYRPA